MAPITKFLTNKSSNIKAKAIEKKQRVHLKIHQKLELIRKLEAGVSVANLCKEFGVAKQTVSDLKKKKVALKKYAVENNVGANNDRRTMKPALNTNLDAAVLKWYLQQRSQGINVRGVEIMAAAEELAQHMNVKCQASQGWLWRFRGFCAAVESWR